MHQCIIIHDVSMHVLTLQIKYQHINVSMNWNAMINKML